MYLATYLGRLPRDLESFNDLHWERFTPWGFYHKLHMHPVANMVTNMLSNNGIKTSPSTKDNMLIMVSFGVPSLPLMHSFTPTVCQRFLSPKP